MLMVVSGVNGQWPSRIRVEEVLDVSERKGKKKKASDVDVTDHLAPFAPRFSFFSEFSRGRGTRLVTCDLYCLTATGVLSKLVKAVPGTTGHCRGNRNRWSLDEILYCTPSISFTIRDSVCIGRHLLGLQVGKVGNYIIAVIGY